MVAPRARAVDAHHTQAENTWRGQALATHLRLSEPGAICTTTVTLRLLEDATAPRTRPRVVVATAAAEAAPALALKTPSLRRYSAQRGDSGLVSRTGSWPLMVAPTEVTCWGTLHYR